MQRFATCVVAVLVSCGGAVAIAQKATTAMDLDAAMKRVGTAQQATAKAIKSGAFDDARKNAATVKQALVDAENFWVVTKKDDAVKMNQEAVAAVTALEKTLSGASPDQQAALGALKQAGATCGACHKQYRAQDENQQYILKLQ